MSEEKRPERKGGLGRGIGSLIPGGDRDAVDVFFTNTSAIPLIEVPGARFMELDPNEIVPNPQQPRSVFEAEAFAELGGVYLAIIGGTAALETTWIEQIEDVDMDDLNPESLWRFKIHDFGPLLVAMDSHGGSIYQEVKSDVARNKVDVLKSLGIES
jgi:hypothetical protein